MVSRTTPAALPWYRYPMLWFVIAGPALVVVAALVTCFIAFRFGDPPLASHAEGAKTPDAPAMAARNHAATPKP